MVNPLRVFKPAGVDGVGRYNVRATVIVPLAMELLLVTIILTARQYSDLGDHMRSLLLWLIGIPIPIIIILWLVTGHA